MNVYSLNETESRIYHYILEQVSRGSDPRLIDVADANYVSTTYVIKTAKKLGFSGYSELLFSMKQGDKMALSQEEMDISLQKIAQSLAELVLQYRTKGIHVFGIGYSSMTAEYLVKKLMAFHIFASDTSPRDLKKHVNDYLAIYISKSGETEDVLEISKVLSGKCHQVLITAAQNSSIMKSVDQSFIIDYSSNNVKQGIDRFDSNCLLMIEYMTHEIKSHVV